MSRAEEAAGAAANPGILADACEALIAAIYLDGGFEAASGFVRRFWEPLIDEMAGPPRDPKTALQEWAQARGMGLPLYEFVATSGPDHAPLFTVAASVAGGEARPRLLPQNVSPKLGRRRRYSTGSPQSSTTAARSER